MAKAKFFAWIDLETTGTDDQEDPILEIGLIVTPTSSPFAQLGAYQGIVQPNRDRYPRWADRMNSYVLKMHSDNGLLRDVGSEGRPLREVEQDCIALLRTIGRPHNFMLAGSGVGHFDRRFIEAQMPDLAQWFQYPNLDVGVLRRALEFAGADHLVRFGQTFDTEGKPHRGLDDVRDHLEEWRQYAAMFSDPDTICSHRYV